MPKRRLRPEPKRDSFDEFIYSLFNGFKPTIIDISETGRITDRAVKWRTTRKITELIDNFHRVKIGVTGDSLIRSDQTDYRANYSTMYLVYKSRSKDYVCDFEIHYINKFWDMIDNRSNTRANRLSTYNGYYYLYVVTD